MAGTADEFEELVREREQTFHAFVRMLTWATALIVVVLLFLALVNA